MMHPRRGSILYGVLMLAILTECTSPTPSLYTIESVPGPVRSGGPRVIALQQIGLSEYLQTLPIVGSSEGYRLNARSNDWWGEPLPAMLARVLVDELEQRLPGSIVLSETGALTASPDATLALNVQRLDQDASGTVVLLAQSSVEFRGKHAPVLKEFRIAVPAKGRGAGAEVAAISAAVGQLADGLSVSLTSGPRA